MISIFLQTSGVGPLVGHGKWHFGGQVVDLAGVDTKSGGFRGQVMVQNKDAWLDLGSASVKMAVFEDD